MTITTSVPFAGETTAADGTVISVSGTASVVSTPPPPPQKTLFGSTVASAADFAQKSAADWYGPLEAARIYNNGGTPPTWAGSLNAQVKCKSVITSFAKDSPADIVAGKFDASYTAFLKSVPLGQVVYLILHHEPEAKIKNGDYSLADFLGAYARVAGLLKAVGNPNIFLTLCLQGYTLLPSLPFGPWKQYLSPHVQVLSWDCYPPGFTGTPAAASTSMALAVAASKSVGLPFGFSEFNTETVVGRDAWLTEVAAFMKAEGALYGTLFDSSQGGNFTVTDAATKAAWKTVIAS